MNQLIKTFAEDTAIATGAFAQSTVVPIDNEPTPRLIVESPLPGPLAQGVVVIPYRVENLRILPLAGPAARNVSPRVGHLPSRSTTCRGCGRISARATRSSSRACRAARTRC